jgi:hypothetical protein
MSELEELIERRNTFFRQRAGLRARAAKLTAKIVQLDEQIDAECRIQTSDFHAHTR